MGPAVHLRPDFDAPVPLARNVSDLAEELFHVIQLNGQTQLAAQITGRRLREHARAWHRDPTNLMLEVAREWDRLGLVRMPVEAGPLGDGFGRGGVHA